jgi:hypothetical protein
MSERGVMSIAVLWIMVGVSAMAAAAAGLAQLERKSAHRVRETQALYLAESALLLEREAGFPNPRHTILFAPGRVTLERKLSGPGLPVQILVSAQGEKIEKNYETEWARSEGGWRALSWKEK